MIEYDYIQSKNKNDLNEKRGYINLCNCSKIIGILATKHN